MPISNKAFRIFLIPLAVFLWAIGWTLFQVGSKPKEAFKHNIKAETSHKENDLTFIVATPEQLEVAQ